MYPYYLLSVYEKYAKKLDSITKQIEELQEELNAQRIDEALSVISGTGGRRRG